MLGKLIKHDFKALSRTLLPANLAVLAATILVTIFVSITNHSRYSALSGTPFMEFLKGILILLTVLIVIAIVAAFFFMTFMVFHHFYKNFMTSEGYLTFTLPVKTHHLLWSKLLTAMIWLVISSLVGILCLFIFMLFGTSSTQIVNSDVARTIAEIFRYIPELGTGRVIGAVLELILMVLVGSASTVLHVYLALVIGGVVTQKHKLLAGIGFYFAINIVMSIISSIITAAFTNSWIMSSGFFNSSVTFSPANAEEFFRYIMSGLQPLFWVSLGLTAVYSVAFFLVSNYLLKNNLNLE